ncbi:hypothetical protein EPI10_011043 [Gossypium australe]|uniref:Uncharacterized protein n=1 Tax=Gossypium australe TaxID=47621 RepID=A0A5B6W662_9ROSI|nr:hypothetical protein EPI10_011043 [Gossypium australe]
MSSDRQSPKFISYIFSADRQAKHHVQVQKIEGLGSLHNWSEGFRVQKVASEKGLGSHRVEHTFFLC